MNKRDFLLKDRIIKGITEDGFFKISLVKTTEVTQTARLKHDLSLLSSVLLGRTLTGTMLLASELKGEERISVRFEGNGPIGMIHAEANSVGEIRGYVQNPGAKLNNTHCTSIGDGIGIGVLSVFKILYNEARPIQGSVEIINGNISEDFAHYLMQSEQVQSAIHLDIGIDAYGNIDQAGGVLAQALPGAPTKYIDHIQENIANMPPLSKQFNDGLYIDEILEQIVSPLKIRVLDRCPVHFYCRCNRDRFKDALKMLSIQDLEEISDTGQELVCHFCNEKYHIGQLEIEMILNEKKTQLN